MSNGKTFEMGENEEQNDVDDNPSKSHDDAGVVSGHSHYSRNLVSFWFFGLCNNFGYSIMLSAAYDILKEESNPSGNSTGHNLTTTVSPVNGSGPLVPGCNRIGTGAILLADVIPSLIVKMTVPFYRGYFPYIVRVGLTVLLSVASLPIVACSRIVGIIIFGVVICSIGSGLGELTFLAMSSHFHKDTVSTWSSGTGMAGLSASLGYLGLTAVLSPRNSLFVMIVVPFIMAFCYLFVLVKPESINDSCKQQPEQERLLNNEEDTHAVSNSLSMKEKIVLLVSLSKYMIPLCLVYFAEYFINQALFELLFFKHSWLSLEQQYRCFQVLYQAGVLISRSSVNCVQIKKLWILPTIQFINLAILFLQVFYHYIPSIWVIFVIILWEGLLGGAAYVNTFYRISTEVPEEQREYSMSVTTMSDALGITVAGFVSIPIHNFICTL